MPKSVAESFQKSIRSRRAHSDLNRVCDGNRNQVICSWQIPLAGACKCVWEQKESGP